MDGKQFVGILKEFGIRIGAVTEVQWRGKQEISPTILRNALHKFESQKLSAAVAPIVEFHKLNLDHGNNKDTLYTRIDDKSVANRYAGKKVPFRVLKGGKAKREDARIKDVATYFSAYRIDVHLIANVEAFLTRLIINNASNLRVESFRGL
jgi:hypothetical protein